MSNLAVGISIGAVLAGSFEQAVASVPKKLAKIGDALAAVKKRDTKFNLLEGAHRDLEATRSKMAGVGKELARVKTAMQSVKGRELTALKREAKKLGSEHLRLGNQVDMARRKVVQSSLAHHKAKKAAAEHTASLGKLGKSFEKMQTQQSRMQNAMAAHAAAQSKFGAARANLFMPLAMATGLGAALKSAGQFQSTLTDIAITADLPREKIAEIGRELGKLASQTGQTRAELAEGFNVLLTAGMDEDAASKVIKTVGLTATAAGAEIGEVARTMYATVNNLKLNPEESLKAMDMLVAAGKAGSFELKDMSKYFPAMTAGASKLGMTGTKAVATLGASLQVAMDGAADPSQAATNMENFMNSLTSPETVKRFEQQGVNLEARFKRWQEKGLDPIEESMKLIQKMTGGDSFRIGELFGNKRVLSFITPMIAGLEKYKQIRADVAAAEGMVSADAMRRMQEDPAFAFKQMGDSLIQLRDAAITPLLAPMGSLFASIINVLAPVTSWMTANTALIGSLGRTFAALLGGKVAFASVVFGIAALRRAWTALGIFMMGSPLMIAIKVLAMGALVIWSNWEPISAWFSGLWNSIKNGASWCWDGIKAVWSGVTGFFSAVWNGVASVTSAVWRVITAPIRWAWNVVKRIWSGITGFFSGLWGGVSSDAVSAWDIISAPARLAWGFVKGIWSGATAFFSGLCNGISSTVSSVWDGIKGAASWAWDGIKAVWSGVGNFFGGLWTSVQTAFSGGIAGVTALLLDWSPLGLVYKVIASGLESLGVQMPEKFSEFGKMMMQGLVDGILGMGKAIGDAVSNVASNTVGWFKDKLGIKSPSRVFMGLGGMVGEGAALGIGGMTRQVGRASAALGTAATVAFAPAFASSMSAALPALADDVTAAAHVGRLPLPDMASAHTARTASAAQATAPLAPTVQQHIVFNITQQTGESGQALARRVVELVRREERQMRRGALGDWA